MKEQVIAELHVVPLGTETASLSHYVAACLNVLKEAEDITYRLTAMGTIVQGPLDRILELAREMHEVPFTMGAKRVATTIYIDDRRDKLISIEGKIKAVLDKNP
ncbi:MTH1187 family thiamine-binding protein [Dehalococcoidia bacterium]|nr:MTH1187 family thiamine-binding protein [Dehalococcoidia bacterium]